MARFAFYVVFLAAMIAAYVTPSAINASHSHGSSQDNFGGRTSDTSAASRFAAFINSLKGNSIHKSQDVEEMDQTSCMGTLDDTSKCYQGALYTCTETIHGDVWVKYECKNGLKCVQKGWFAKCV